MIYKFLNTIVDDLFAFMVRMPLLARMSMFRDDVVFVIYIYQRYIYRVDKNRTVPTRILLPRKPASRRWKRGRHLQNLNKNRNKNKLNN